MLRVKPLKEGLAVLTVTEARLVAANAPNLREELGKAIDGGLNRIVLDLTAVSFIDSSGLGAIVGALKRVSARGDLVVCGLGPAAAQLFRLTRMDKVFRIFDSADDAIAALG